MHRSRLHIDVAVRLLGVRRWIVALLNVCTDEARDYCVSLLLQHEQERGLYGDTVCPSLPKKTEVVSGNGHLSHREKRAY